MQHPAKIILGVDPGTLVLGYSIISVSGQQLKVEQMSVLKLNARRDHYERLQLIHQKISDLISLHQPQYFAIEAPFFGKNVQSMLKLGRAQGVAIAAAMSAGLEVFEYSPKKVKQSITGNGNADKEQVWKMLQRIVSLAPADLRYLDASDALAVAICHHFQSNSVVPPHGAKVNGWSDFIAKNPGRIKVK